MLKKTDEFSSVFNFRQRVSSAFFTLHYLPNQIDVQKNARFGFIIAKKKVKLSVERNYMRRVLREFCRATDLPLHVDVIIQAQRKFERAEFDVVKADFALILNKILKKLPQPTAEIQNHA
jgi:ribonuclease P protein component